MPSQEKGGTVMPRSSGVWSRERCVHADREQGVMRHTAQRPESPLCTHREPRMMQWTSTTTLRGILSPQSPAGDRVIAAQSIRKMGVVSSSARSWCDRSPWGTLPSCDRVPCPLETHEPCTWEPSSGTFQGRQPYRRLRSDMIWDNPQRCGLATS